MLQGLPLVVPLIGAVAFIIVATAKLKIHAFLTLLIPAYGTRLAAGVDPKKVATLVTDGFGSVLGAIGIVILAGTIIGTTSNVPMLRSSSRRRSLAWSVKSIRPK